MKKILIIVLTICCLTVPAMAAQVGDFEMLLSALTRSTQQFLKATERSDAYDIVLRRDPMQSLVDDRGLVIHAAGLHEGLMVQGIIWSDNFRSALIDDEFYSEGDQVGPYKIQTIQSDGFWATREGEDEKIFVPLYEAGAVAEQPVIVDEAKDLSRIQ